MMEVEPLDNTMQIEVRCRHPMFYCRKLVEDLPEPDADEKLERMIETWNSWQNP